MNKLADISFFNSLCRSDNVASDTAVFNDSDYVEITLHRLTGFLNTMFPNLQDIPAEELAGDIDYNRARLDAAAFLSDVVASELANGSSTKTELRGLLTSNAAELRKTTGCEVSEILSGEYCNRRIHVLV